MTQLVVISTLSVLAFFSLCVWQMVDRRRERQEVRAERADLLLRLSETQGQTVIRHHNEQAVQHAPPAVNPELDEDYWVSKEDLAEQMAREEANGG